MNSSVARGRFGTFGGVFTPSVLTILGVIMFMRSGAVVGDVGIWRALIILAIAKTITGLTAVSLSAIATNTEVGTGGNYFMISRTLGPDIGGTIGITLFISQAVAVAFYVIGFTEALLGLVAAVAPDFVASVVAYKGAQLVSSVTIGLLFVLTFKGADVAMRAQYIILAVLMASVASFLLGGALAFDSGTFADNAGPIEGSIGLWAAFAIFFPAATGIDAGANMSGDLKDPARSIARGTFAAIIFTTIIYLAQLILIAGFTDAQTLVSQPFQSLQRMSVFGPLVAAGVFAATLSSALSSFLGAPRILQAMGKDRLLRVIEPFAVGHGAADEPRRATVLTLLIALAVVWAGSLDAIAEIISMFFLIAYGMINLSAFVEGRGGNPSFRPRFRAFGWPAALVGAIGCTIAMVKINETYAIVSIILAWLIYVSLRGRTRASWSDAKRGYTFAVTRDNLFELERSRVDAKNWRPVIACLTDDAARDRRMIDAGAWMESGRGLLSVLEITCAPELDGPTRARERLDRSDALRDQLRDAGVRSFADAFVLAQPGVEPIVQAYSLGSFRPNTLVLTVPPPQQAGRRAWMVAAVEAVAPLGRNVVIYKGTRDAAARKRRIDVWWAGEKNGSLMALLAYLIKEHPSWRQAEIRMLRVVHTASEHLEAEQSLRQLMEAARIRANVDVVLSHAPVTDIIAERSASADLVLLGLAHRDLTDFDAYLERSDALLARLPAALLVASNGEIDLLA